MAAIVGAATMHTTVLSTLVRAINEGAPLYNAGDEEGCFLLYLGAAEALCDASFPETDDSSASSLLDGLNRAVQDASKVGAGGAEGEAVDYAQAAWLLRRAFDETIILAERSGPLAEAGAGGSTEEGDAAVLEGWSGLEGGSSHGTESEAGDSVEQLEDLGESLANVSFVLTASVVPKRHTRISNAFGVAVDGLSKAFEDSFLASEAVETLVSLGLGPTRKDAAARCTLLLSAGLLVPVSHPKAETFADGRHLYRFPTTAEVVTALERAEAAVAEMEKGAPGGAGGGHSPGGGSALSPITRAAALRSTLDFGDHDKPEEGGESPEGGGRRVLAALSTRHLLNRASSSVASSLPQPHREAKERGAFTAALLQSVEGKLSIADRKYRLRTYPACFVGAEAVDVVLKEGLGEGEGAEGTTREQATQELQRMLKGGLIQHVTAEHEFEDASLFYRVVPVKELKTALDVQANFGNSPSVEERENKSALLSRYKQFTSLSVDFILNNFYACDGPDGWDISDLTLWRTHMKRWGFGRPKDRDDEMFDRLAPLLLSVDPDTWDVTGDAEWESPWGIIAQIAIFDQISRAAFRGTANAFKWDELAKTATRRALEMGYFETAFSSTLNLFVLLLPLEHSESWDDQKLGVSLLLRMLSTVAVLDEGFTDTEIVKRLEFSKRLSVAFLEHAQVIAKFKRYPHRNKAEGRSTSLEERIWLASDIVPIWAKSQNPSDAKSLLPAIPLKKLIKR